MSGNRHKSAHMLEFLYIKLYYKVNKLVQLIYLSVLYNKVGAIDVVVIELKLVYALKAVHSINQIKPHLFDSM